MWVLLLVLALSGLVLVRPLDRQATVLLLDASASVTPVRDQVEAAARTAVAGLSRGNVLGVVAVGERSAGGGDAIGRAALSAGWRPACPAPPTDLASGLRLAGALLPEGYAGRVALISDGRQTRGDAVAAARELAGGVLP